MLCTRGTSVTLYTGIAFTPSTLPNTRLTNAPRNAIWLKWYTQVKLYTTSYSRALRNKSLKFFPPSKRVRKQKVVLPFVTYHSQRTTSHRASFSWSPAYDSSGTPYYWLLILGRFRLACGSTRDLPPSTFPLHRLCVYLVCRVIGVTLNVEFLRIHTRFHDSRIFYDFTRNIPWIILLTIRDWEQKDFSPRLLIT